ncbi:hypothetical protein NF701_12360 [Sphingomonadaceae bacterium OTU29THOMA1]|nr:hypothetical protein NF701_12360 [Sphingomonadaceae bacterium OTU29THOMA1]
MSRDRSAAATPLPPLAHGGRLAQLAAERFPLEGAPMSKGDRAAYWLGEYVKARRELPHLKPSDLLALIAEQDAAACGATFTRTIKRLAQPHLSDRPKATPSPARAPGRKVPEPVPPAASPTPPVSTTAAVPPPTLPSGRVDDHGATDPDLLARMERMRATRPGQQA